jgi:hypothetical protein
LTPYPLAVILAGMGSLLNDAMHGRYPVFAGQRAMIAELVRRLEKQGFRLQFPKGLGKTMTHTASDGCGSNGPNQDEYRHLQACLAAAKVRPLSAEEADMLSRYFAVEHYADPLQKMPGSFVPGEGPWCIGNEYQDEACKPILDDATGHTRKFATYTEAWWFANRCACDAISYGMIRIYDKTGRQVCCWGAGGGEAIFRNMSLAEFRQYLATQLSGRARRMDAAHSVSGDGSGEALPPIEDNALPRLMAHLEFVSADWKAKEAEFRAERERAAEAGKAFADNVANIQAAIVAELAKTNCRNVVYNGNIYYMHDACKKHGKPARVVKVHTLNLDR